MNIYEVSLRVFRGFENLTFKPGSDVALVGEPRAGRSNLIEGLRRVLTSGGVRYTTPSELDLWMLDLSRRAEVEVVVGDLGSDLEQDFLDHLEAWDLDEDQLASPRPPTEGAEPANTEWVLRLCYRLEWDSGLEQAVHWVDFPGESDPTGGTYARVPRRLHDLLPVVVVGGVGLPLRLGPQSDFRRVLDSSGGANLSAALGSVVDAITDAGDALAKSPDVKASLVEVFRPVEGPLGVDADEEGLVQFVPEGGSLSGVLRAMQPAVDLGGPGHLPLHRHGATAAALIQAGEAIAAARGEGAVVLIDDFGEDLDSLSARHLASEFRKRSGQVWLSSRRSAAIEAFPPQDIVRLHVEDGTPLAAQMDAPTTKSERVAARHLSLQLLPAASASAVAIVEGPHDRAALEAVAGRLAAAGTLQLPAFHGVAIIDAAAADGSGGAAAVARLAELGSRLGFHTIAVIDGDPGADGAAYLASNTAAADRVVRLPDGAAIERALIEGVPEGTVIATISDLCSAFGIAEPPDLDEAAGNTLLTAVVRILKKNGGLHGQFVELLPARVIPPTVERILGAIIESGVERLTGLDQL